MGINKAQELKKIQTLKEITQGEKSGEFNINLDPVHLDTSNTYHIKSRNLSLLSKKTTNVIMETQKGLKTLNSSTTTPPLNSSKELELLVKDQPLTLEPSKVGIKSYLVNPIAPNTKGLENLGNTRDFSIVKPLNSQDMFTNRGLDYLTNNIEHISLSPKIGFKNGLLIKYQKFISYNFNKSAMNPKEKANLQAGNISRASDFVNDGRSRVVLSYNKEVRDTYELLFYFFKSIYCLISKPVFLHSADKVIIQLFYFLNIPQKLAYQFFSLKYIKSFEKKWLKKKSQAFSIKKNNSIFHNSNTQRFSQSPRYANGKLFIKWRILKTISRLRDKSNIVRNLLFNLRKFNLSKVYHRKFDLICQILSKKFNKSVEFQLIRLHDPIHDSNILVNLLSLNIRNKTKNAKGAIRSFYERDQIKVVKDPSLESINLIPAYLSGLYIKIAGRLMREPIIPKITTRITEKGASSIGKVNYLDVATITKKNRKGAYTITIKSGQNFFMPTFKKRKNLLNSKV